VGGVSIDATLVRALLAAQHPDLAHLPLTAVGGGWDNRLFRLGDHLAVRLPCRPESAPLVEHERRWLPALGPLLPLPVPVPVRAGRPGLEYPWSWSVVPWFDGESLLNAPVQDEQAVARAIAGFILALHQAAPEEAPPNPWRGVPLSARTAILYGHLEQLGGAVDRTAVLRAWHTALGASPWPRAPVWIHGDLHPGNLIVRDGHVAAVVDFGDLTAGDPATDLSLAWMLPSTFRRAFLAAVAAAHGDLDHAVWTRARGWALALGVAYMAASPPGDALIALGRTTLEAVLADAS
jgi:aminoglycoside phosphotransferase (APT) family kinase protein